MKNVILITGAGGFLGGSLCNHLSSHFNVRGLVKNKNHNHNLVDAVDVVYADLAIEEIPSDFFSDVCAIIHCAGIAHKKNKSTQDQMYLVNCDATLRLAKIAVKKNIQKFIFISSIGVLGESSRGEILSEQSTPKPFSPYTKSKYLAETALMDLSKKTHLEVVILRAPLIYGKGAPGNYSRIVRLIGTRLPLPFKRLRNKRAYISIENMMGVVEAIIASEGIKNEVFIVSDGENIMLCDFINKISSIEGLKTYLYSAPFSLLFLIALILNKKHDFLSLTNELEADTSKVQKMLGWIPRNSM
jgi:nucleoside-diphosphate-sugar epimerase